MLIIQLKSILQSVYPLTQQADDIMYQVSDQEQRMRGSTCSSQTELEQNKFDMVNNIYQLHSIINRTSIDKQKYRIAYASLLQNMQEITSNKQKELAEINDKVNKSVKQITFLRQRLEQEKTRANGLAKERDTIAKQLDLVVQSQSKSSGQRITVNMIIAEYGRLKKQLNIKNQLAQKQNQELHKKQLTIKDQAQQLSSLRQSLTKQVESLRQQMWEQRAKFQQCIDNRSVQWQKQRSELVVKIEKQVSAMNELQIQNNSNLKRILDLQTKLGKYQHINLEMSMSKELQYNKQNDLYHRQKRQKTVQQDMLNQRQAKYEEILNQNHQLLQQTSRKKSENAYLLNKCEQYVKQIEQIRRQLVLAKQQNDKFKQVVLSSQNLSPVKRQSLNDHIVKFQETLISFQSEKKKLMKLLAQETEKCKMLDNKNSQKQQQLQILKHRIKILQTSLSHTEQQHQQNIEQLSLTKQQVYNLRLQNSRLKSQLSFNVQKKDITLLQSQAEQTQIVKISANKYEQMLNNIRKKEQQIHVIIKEKVELQVMLHKSDQNCNNFRRQLGQKQLQIDELNRKVNKISRNYQQSIDQMYRLQARNDKMKKQADEQISSLISTISNLKQCIADIKQRNNQFDKIQKKLMTKNNNKYYMSKVMQLTIIPQANIKANISDKMRVKLETTKRTVEGLTRPSSEQQFINTSMPQIRQIKQYVNTSNSNDHEPSPAIRLRQMMRKQEDKELDRTIRQLKKQKRELSLTRKEQV